MYQEVHNFKDLMKKKFYHEDFLYIYSFQSGGLKHLKKL